LILLTFAIRLSQLTAATLEHHTRQAMATFSGVDLNEQVAAVHLVVGQIEQVERLAYAPILG
jgi:hypothetical protein